jgi:DNA polymerase III delta prime subunit
MPIFKSSQLYTTPDMVESTMTYIIPNKSIEIQKKEVAVLLERVFGKQLDSSPDMHILNPKEENSIGIEEVKEFQQSMRFKPFQEQKQVGIILQAEKLTPQAQNSLLKTLEETSDTSIYILCVDNERNLLPTIRSRGIIRYSKSQEVEKTSLEGKKFNDFLKLHPVEQFNIIEEYAKEKESSITLIDSLEELFRKQLELDIKNGNIDSSQRNLAFLKVIEKSREKISANCNRRLTLEAMIVQLKT